MNLYIKKKNAEYYVFDIFPGGGPPHTHSQTCVSHTNFPGFKPYDCVKILSVCVKLDTQPNCVGAGSAAFFQNIIYLSCLLKNT